MIIELIGYFGSLLVVVSMLMTSVIKLRIINTVGSLIFTVYALIIKSYPTALMNFSLVLINVYNLYRLLKVQKDYSVIPLSADEAFYQYFLNRFEKNIRRFGCDNVAAAQGICPDALRDAPAPDKVFIGGSTGKIAEILSVINEKNSDADIVVTAVSLETLGSATEAFESFGGSYDVMHISVANTKRISGYTMFQAQNPVFLIKGKIRDNFASKSEKYINN